MKSLTIKNLVEDKQSALQDIRQLETNLVMARGIFIYLEKKIKDLGGEKNES